MHFNDRQTRGDGEAATNPLTNGADEARNEPLAISVREFCRRSSLGRTTAFKLLREGQLEGRRIGGRTVILMRSVEVLLELRGKAS